MSLSHILGLVFGPLGSPHHVLGRVLVLCATGLIAGPRPAWAQAAATGDRPLVVERPSFSTPPDLVGERRWQIETGISWRRLSEDERDSPLVTTAPNLTLRVGVHPRLELRLASSGVDWWTVGGQVSRTIANSAVGVKYHLLLERHTGLDLSLVPMVTMGWPHDSSPSASVVVTAAKVLGPLGLNANLVLARDWSDAPAIERDLSLAVTEAMSPNWSAFAELVRVQTAADQPGQWSVNTGIGRLLGSNMAADLYVGRPARGVAGAWRYGVGLSWRSRNRPGAPRTP